MRVYLSIAIDVDEKYPTLVSQYAHAPDPSKALREAVARDVHAALCDFRYAGQIIVTRQVEDR